MKIIFKNSSAVFTTYKLSEKTKVLFDSSYFAGLTLKQKSYLDYFIVSMINNGIWQKLKRFYVPCFTTADGGFINIKPTIDNGQITIDQMTGLGKYYHCEDYKGIVANANITTSIFTDNYSQENGYSMFGYASEGTVGTLYYNNSYLMYSLRGSVKTGILYVLNDEEKKLDVVHTGAFVISAKNNFGAVSNLETYKERQDNFVPEKDFYASFYINFAGGTAYPYSSLIKYFGVGDGLTGDEVKFLAEKMNILNTVL